MQATRRPSLGVALRPRAKVMPEDARRHNRSLVLQTLYAGEMLSRADLARSTGLTRVTISDLVSGLVQEGLVVESGLRASPRPGKPATMLAFDDDARQVVGLDLSGATAFRGALLDLRGRVLDRHDVPLGAAVGSEALGLVLGLVRELVGRARRPLLGIGIGSPGVVDPAGVVRSAPNLGWRDLDLRAEVAAAVEGVPTQVTNDANAAALAEHSFGAGGGDLMLVRIGHGVGAGLMVGGTPLFGSHFAAGEIGHVVVGTDGGRPCACGKHGCLETWLSTPSLRAQIEQDDTGDPGAVLREAGRRLGVALAPIVGALDLAEIVLSGPPDLLEGDLAGAAIQTLHDRTMPDFHGHLTVRMSELGDDIVVQGAAAVVLSGHLGVA